jgi:hypothetical protein
MSKNLDLSEIFNKYGTDKDKNGYTALYHLLFNNLRNSNLLICEIGIGTMIPNVKSSMLGYGLQNYKPGGSLRAWRDYFFNSNIVGFDIQLDTQFEEERIKTFLCDSTNLDSVSKTMTKIEGQFDIIIDDGSHKDEDQFNTLKNFYPYLKNGGIYIIEDIYPGSMVSNNPEIIGNIIEHDPFFYVGLKNNLCVIYKNHLNITAKNNY